MNDKRAIDAIGWALLLAAVAFIVVCCCTGCARGYGNGPRSDGEQQEIERIRAERKAGKDCDRLRELTGGGH